MCADALTAAITLPLSYWFLEQVFNKNIAQDMLWLLPVSSVITIGVFYFSGLYRTAIRFASVRLFLHVLIASVVVSGLVAAIALASVYGEKVGFPRRIFILFAFTLSVGVACTRLFARHYFDRMRSKNRTPVIVYGAGSGGSQLYSALRFSSSYNPVAFVDDDSALQGRTIHGLRVYKPKKLVTLIESKKVKTILLAMPSLSFENRTKIINSLKSLNIEIKTTPSLQDMISEKANLADLHAIPIEELMTRQTVQPNELLACHCVKNKSVLITGAGGSIGSELCRQIILREPSCIVLYEMTESSLFYLEQELQIRALQAGLQEMKIIPILGSVLNRNCLKSALLTYEVDTVFHAAAYKHVPMLESNPIEGLRNNVLGTKTVAEACNWARIANLVVVSTDKAVRPTNLMGASKRLAELIVHATVQSNDKIKTCMVRFGNVLGSSGSVVPTFKEQIKRGGPVTVTHKDMTRFFMTIPEASQLVLQAGAMAQNTEIFVLDMGKPMYIADLAKRMINLSGLTVRDESNPDGNIEILYTGLRAGEKMFEELSLDDNLEATTHPKINKAIEVQDNNLIMQLVEQLELAIEQGDHEEAIAIVCRAVPEYTPSKKIQRRFCVEIPTGANTTTSCNS